MISNTYTYDDGRYDNRTAVAAANNSNVRIIRATKPFVDNLLAHNVGNRTISPMRVKALADDMRNGRWKFNGDTIVVDMDDRLVDGQHRLTAIREAGYPPLDLLVVKLSTRGGASNDVFMTIDCGRPRTMTDTLHVEGQKYAGTVAAIARLIVMLYKGMNSVPTKAEMHAVLEVMREEIEAFAGFTSKKVGLVKFMAPTVAAFALVAYMYTDIPTIRDFADNVLNGVGLDHDTPEYILLSYLCSRRGKHVSSQAQREVFCASYRAALWCMAGKDALKRRTVKGNDEKTINHIVTLIKTRLPALHKAVTKAA